jgi:hypothetical protein
MQKLAMRFQRNIETINRVYYKIIYIFFRKKIYKFTIKNPSSSSPLYFSIAENPRFYSFFKDYIRAINSIYIPVSFKVSEKIIFRDYYNNLSQNILNVYNFDIKFTNLLVR